MGQHICFTGPLDILSSWRDNKFARYKLWNVILQSVSRTHEALQFSSFSKLISASNQQNLPNCFEHDKLYWGEGEEGGGRRKGVDLSDATKPRYFIVFSK